MFRKGTPRRLSFLDLVRHTPSKRQERRAPDRARSGRISPVLEQLEVRELLSIDFNTISIQDISPDNSDLDASDPDGASMGRINQLAVVAGDNQTLYAASEFGGVFRSTNGGVNWDHLDNHEPQVAWDVEVDPSNANRVYATSFYDGRVSSISGIQVSTDAGATWTHPLTSDANPALEGTVNDNTPQPGYSAVAARRAEPAAYGIAIRPDAPNNVFIGTNAGLAISNDSGATWRIIDPTPATPATNVWDVAVQSGGPNGMGIIDIVGDDGHQRSVDGGNTWTTDTLNAAFPAAVGLSSTSVAVSPDENYVVFVVGVDSNLYESDDAGATWTNLGATDPINGGGRIPFVVTNNQDDNTGNDFDVWTGGVSLYRIACDSQAMQGGTPRCAAGANPLPATWFGGFTRGGLGSATGAHDDLGDVVFDSEVALGAPPVLMANDGGVYYATTTSARPTGTGNLVFEQPTVGPHALWIFGMAGVDLGGDDDEAIYIGMQDSGNFATLNAGATTPTWHQEDCCDVFDLAADDDTVLFSFGSVSGTPRPFRLFLGDSGMANTGQVNTYPGNVAAAAAMAASGGDVTTFNNSESIVNFGDNSYAVLMNDSGNFGDGGLHITTDITASPIVWTELVGGTGDEPFSSADLGEVQVAFDGGGTPTFFVSVGDGGGYTADQLWSYVGTGTGATWTRLDTNIDGGTGGVSLFAADRNDPNRLYASFIDPVTGPRMVFSNDGGATWMNDTELDNLMTGGGAFQYQTQRGPRDFPNSEDSGAPARGLGVYFQPTLLAFDPEDSDIIVAGGMNSGVFISFTAGQSWQLLTDPLGVSDDPSTTLASGLPMDDLPNIPRPRFIHFDHVGGTLDLYVGTQGRGVFRISSVEADTGVLTICGDEDYVNQDDTIRLVRDPSDPGILQVFLNNGGVVPDFTTLFAGVQQINVFGVGGNDNLIVDSTNGLISVPRGIRYDGDGTCPDNQGFFGAEGFGYDRGIDRLTLEQTNGPTHVSDSIEVGATAGTGVSTIVGAGATQTVYFEELEPIVDGVPAASLTIDGGTVGTILNRANAINYETSDLFGTTWGKVTIDDFEPIHFTNKTTLIINAENGSDEINLNNPSTPTGLTGDCDASNGGSQSICIFGDDPTASDTVIVNGTAAANSMTFTPTGVDSATVASTGQPTVSLAGVEHLVINGQGGTDDLTVNGTSVDDTTTIRATAGTGTFRSAASPTLDFQQFEDWTVTGGAGGFDVLAVEATEGPDTVAVAGTVVTVNVTGVVNISAGIDRLDVSTFGSIDSVTVTGLLIPSMFDLGSGNDTLAANVTTTGAMTIFGRDGNDSITGGNSGDLIFGGFGNDTMIGAGGNDVIYGEDGNDTFGNASSTPNGVADDGGNDTFFGGDGSDLFVWEPGDGSDLIEGGAGSGDELRFIGSAGNNRVEIFGGGGSFVNPAFDMPGDAERAVVALNSTAFLTATVFVDTADVEAIHLDLLGGTDEAIINNQVPNNSTAGSFLQSGTDLAHTHVTSITVDLGSLDAVADRVEVHGRVVADDVNVRSLGTNFALGPVDVAGFDYAIDINQSVGPTDLLIIRGQTGDDSIKAEDGTDVRIAIQLDGDEGNDFLSADATLNGGANNDFLEGGSGDDVINGGAGEDTMIGLGGADTFDGGADFDTILIRGTSGNDVIVVNQTAATTLVHTVNGATETDTLVTVAGVRTVERARIEAGDGDDVVTVTWADSLGVDAFVNSLRMDVVGGADFTRDRLGVIDGGTGDLNLYRRGESDETGSMTIGPSNAEPLEAVFQGVEYAEPVIPAGGQAVVFKHDPFEFNNLQFLATHLGADHTINIDPTIDPGIDPATGLPADQDFYRFEAQVTGTLDLQVFFEEIPTVPSGRPGLPGNGNLNIELYDRDGTLIAGAGPLFGGNDGGGTNPELNLDGEAFAEDERIRIPAVQGQVYYLRVFGATPTTINNYTMTIENEAPPVPFDMELQDNPNNPAYACPQVGAPAGSNSDTGRSRLDNITCDATPTLFFRLDDGTFLHDLPGNSVNDSPPDEVIPIPFRAGPAQPVLPGYAIAIFDEGTTVTQVGTAPQIPLGFASATAQEGVYTFTTPLLSDGSHFLTARVQMIDPALPQQTGFGPRSVSLEIIVDTLAPPVAQSAVSTVNLELDRVSDTGVVEQPSTHNDRATSDTTPTFFGFAEADTVVRVYVDVNANGAVDAGDVLIAQTTTEPYDGSDQFGQSPPPALSPNIGRWVATSNVDLNNPLLGFPLDGRRVILATFEDQAGNESAPAALEIFIDTRGPQVATPPGAPVEQCAVNFDPIDAALPEECVFGVKPLQINGPTPLTRTVVINMRDLPARATGSAAIAGGPFLYGAVNSIVAATPGQYVLTGDLNGVIAISSIVVINNPVVDGQVPTARIELNFNTPLPDDRYTLTISDAIVDDVGNALDGESNSQEPLDTPSFPTGDGQPGEDYIARFTVDSRPEVGTFCCGSWYIDLNQNGQFDDPNNHDTDFTNADVVYKFGLPGDFPVVGDWDGNGFDEIGVYGRRPDGFRFELDLNGNGTFDAGDASFLFNATGPAAGGRPVAGAWLQSQLLPELPGQDLPGGVRRVDHVAVFNGTTWFADLTAAPYTAASSPPATAIVTAARGRPIAADFNGDGDDDIGLFTATTNIFTLDVASDDDFQADTNIIFGFNTVNQWPVAADWDADRDGNIGLFETDRNGMMPREAGEFYLDLGRPFTGPLSGPLSAIFGGPGAQAANAGDGLFQPPPTGGLPTAPNLPYVFQDIFYQFGDEAAEPIVGNFDPPRGAAELIGAIERPLVRLDHSNTASDSATPVFVWDGAGHGTESGSIEAAGDRDYLRFTPTTSGRISIDAKKRDSAVDTKLVVQDSDGQVVVRNSNYGGSTDSHVELNVVAGETYYINVTGSRRTTGDYDVLVDYLLSGGGPVAPGTGGADDHGNTAHTGTPLTLNSGATTRSGGKLAAGDVDYFVFRPSVSGRLDLNVAGLSRGLNTAVDVFDSNGLQLATNDDAHAKTSNSRVTVNIEAGQTYSFRVRSVGPKAGDYSVALDLLLANVI